MLFYETMNIQKKDWNYRFVNYFLNNRQLTVLAFLCLIIGGLVSFSTRHVEGFPAVQVPIAVVSTTLPGASPQTVNDTITVPLEGKLKDLKGLNEISSTSQNNVSVIILTFKQSADINQSLQDARNKINTANLPENAGTPDIIVPETGSAPFVIAVTGNKNLQDLLDAGTPLKDEISLVKGTKSVELLSDVKQNIYIDLSPQYSTAEIINQLKTANIDFPLGQIVVSGNNVPVSGAALAKNTEDLKNLPVVVNGQSVKLGSIADIYEGIDYKGKVHRIGYLDTKGDKTFRIQAAVLYQVKVDEGTDLIAYEKKFNEAVNKAQEAIGGKGIAYTVMYSQAQDARQQVKEIVEGAVGGKWSSGGILGNFGYIFGAIWLLLITMLVFLDWRSAIISVLAIPLSFLFTFIYLNLAGIQLNTLVLFSLVLVLGLIVDPAIVVMESIHRYLDLGYKGDDAVLHSISRIGRGVFIAVLTSAVVFIPFAIVSGTFGQIIKYIPLTVFPALIASYFVPMIFLTWLGSKFLKPKSVHAETWGEDDPGSLWPVARWFIGANRYILSRKWLQILVIVLGVAIPIIVSGALFAAGKVRQVQFAKAPDSQFLLVSLPFENNSTDAQLVQVNSQFEDVIKNHASEIQNYYYMERSTVFIQLVPKAERKDNSGDIVKQIQKELNEKFGDKALVSEPGVGGPEGTYPITVKIFENDPTKALEASKKIATELKANNKVSTVVYDGEESSSSLVINIDKNKIISAGVNPAIVFGQIASVFNEKTATTINEKDLVVRVKGNKKPESVEELKAMPVLSAKGLIPLGSIADIHEEQSPQAIKRLNGERYTEVDARLKDDRDLVTVQRDITQWSKDHAQEMGLSDRAFENRASVNDFEKSFQELFAAIGISILFTYIIFVLFFKSFAQPFIILFAAPLIFIGVFPGLVIFTGGQFGFLEIIGIIMVIGIVENVGIFLIDYANQKVAEGMDKKEAIAVSSGIRFRPIILTKLTALAGLMPLAIFAPFWRGLAVVVIAGILSSGILSLFTTPVLYNWFTRTKKIKENN
jgi:multidrug efflux pump subunit AcrB